MLENLILRYRYSCENKKKDIGIVRHHVFSTTIIQMVSFDIIMNERGSRQRTTEISLCFFFYKLVVLIN